MSLSCQTWTSLDDVIVLQILGLSLAVLRRLIYIRPDPRENLPGFGADHNRPADFNDHAHLRKHHPEVMIFQDILKQQRASERPELTYNELQLMLHAESERFVSVLGGNCILASYFAGTSSTVMSRMSLASSWCDNCRCLHKCVAMLVGSHCRVASLRLYCLLRLLSASGPDTSLSMLAGDACAVRTLLAH